MKIEKKVST